MKIHTKEAATDKTKMPQPNSTLTKILDNLNIAEVSGINRVTDKSICLSRRIIWLLFVVTFMCLTVYMVIVRIDLYIQSPKETIIELYRPDTLTIPSVAICYEEHLNLSFRINISNGSGIVLIRSGEDFTVNKKCVFTPPVTIEQTFQTLETYISYPIKTKPEDLFIDFAVPDVRHEYESQPIINAVEIHEAVKLSAYASLVARIEIVQTQTVGDCDSSEHPKQSDCVLNCTLGMVAEKCVDMAKKNIVLMASVLADRRIRASVKADNVVTKNMEKCWFMFKENAQVVKEFGNRCGRRQCKDKCKTTENKMSFTLTENGTASLAQPGSVISSIIFSLRKAEIPLTTVQYKFNSFTDYLTDLGGTLGVLVGGCIVTLLQIIDWIMEKIYMRIFSKPVN